MTQLEVGGKSDGDSGPGVKGDCALIRNNLFSKGAFDLLRSFYFILFQTMNMRRSYLLKPFPMVV